MRPLAVIGLAWAVLTAGACGSGPAAEAEPAETTTTATTATPSTPAAPAAADAPTGTTTLAVAPTAGELDAALDAAFARHEIPGMAVAVLRDGEIVFAGGFGVDPGTGGAISDATLFQAASISKPTSTMMVATLVEEGLVSWDDDVRDLLSSFELVGEFPGEVTLAQLVSHTAGTSVSGFIGYPEDAEPPTVPELLRGEGNSEPVVVAAPPGGGFAYSGGGFIVLQQGVIDAIAPDFAALMEERVLRPAGMETATFAQPLPPELRAMASSASVGSNVAEPFTYPELAAAGLWTSAPDLARLVASFQSALRGEAAWLSADSAAFMIEPVAPAFGAAIGHGWFVRPAATPTWFSHEGANIGFESLAIGSVDGRHGLAVLTNASGAGELIFDVAETVGDLEQWPPRPG